MARYIVTNTRRGMLVLVDFQDDYLQCKLPNYILVRISRVAI